MSDSELDKRVMADAGSLSGEVAKARSVPTSFGFKMRRVQVAYNRRFAQVADREEIPVNQIGALALIVRNPGITPTELASLLNLDAAQVTPLIKHLDVRGCISRQKSTLDNRSHFLHATAKGGREYQRLQGIIAAVEDEFLGEVLQQAEIEQLFGMFDRLEAAGRLRASQLKIEMARVGEDC